MDSRHDAGAAATGSQSKAENADGEQEYTRRQNRAADGDLIGWPEVTLRWRTRRGWPTASGWLVAFPSFLVSIAVLGPFVGSAPAPRTLGNLAVAAIASAIAVGIVVLVPPLHQPLTATWTMTASPSFIRLDAESPRQGRMSQEIRRIDAGKLQVQTKKGERGRPYLASATGTSIDGRVTISLPDYSVSSGGWTGHLLRIPIAVVLISWWPANHLSVSGLLDFEQLGVAFWYPEGVPPRPRPNLRADF